jgi:hypothetical protein
MKMKKLFATLISFGLIAFNGLPAQALPVRFSPEANTNGGAIYGKVPLEKLGPLTLPRGRVNLKSHTIEVSAIPEFQFERQVILSGPILKCAAVNSGGLTYINGIAYFDSGDWLKYIDDRRLDRIITDNQVYMGQITALKNGAIEITPTGALPVDIPLANVRDVSSPRAYTFSIPVKTSLSAPVSGVPVSGDAAYMSIKPSSQVLTMASVRRDPLMASDGDWSNRKLVAIGVGMAAIQAAQVIPLAITFGPVRNQLARQYNGRFQKYYDSQNFLNNYFGSGQLIPITPFAPGALPGSGGI